jgi:hypothetical protein
MYISIVRHRCFNSLQSTNAPSWMRDCRDWVHSVSHTNENTIELAALGAVRIKANALKARKMGGNFDVHCGCGRSPYIPYRRLRRPGKRLRVHRVRESTMRTCGNLSEANCIVEA